MKVGGLHLFMQLTTRVACVRGRETDGKAKRKKTRRPRRGASCVWSCEGGMSGARRRSSGRSRHLHGILSARQHDSELARDVLSGLANLHKTCLLTAFRRVFFMCVGCCGLCDAVVSAALLCLPELITKVCKRHTRTRRCKLRYGLEF